LCNNINDSSLQLDHLNIFFGVVDYLHDNDNRDISFLSLNCRYKNLLGYIEIFQMYYDSIYFLLDINWFPLLYE
jgi:hypothetical protein